jgi:hypothetical protein
MGLIPKTLRPVFRDRDDFTAGHSLSEQTLAALDDSAAFIVIGSPDAAPADNPHHSGRKADGRVLPAGALVRSGARRGHPRPTGRPSCG